MGLGTPRAAAKTGVLGVTSYRVEKMAMLTFGRVVRSALVAGALGVLPLSIAAASSPFGSSTNSCTGGSLNICLGFNLAQIGNSKSHYSLDLILDAINSNPA